jgi:hypothetical protein
MIFDNLNYAYEINAKFRCYWCRREVALKTHWTDEQGQRQTSRSLPEGWVEVSAWHMKATCSTDCFTELTDGEAEAFAIACEKHGFPSECARPIGFEEELEVLRIKKMRERQEKFL